MKVKVLRSNTYKASSHMHMGLRIFGRTYCVRTVVLSVTRSTESQALQPQGTKAFTGLYSPVHLLWVRDFRYMRGGGGLVNKVEK